MSKPVINLDRIQIDSNGRVVIDDSALLELEKNTSVVSAGAGGENTYCSGNNAGCINTTDCSGSTNVSCRNDLTCVRTTGPGRQ